jgi:hypothetical protein
MSASQSPATRTPSSKAAGRRGQDVLLGGEYKGIGIEFAYLTTDGDLGVITEIFSGAPGEDQQPDATYP